MQPEVSSHLAVADAPAIIDSILNEAPTQKSSSAIEEDYRIRIPSFEGPLDLLLHLIRKEQIDIDDIPISLICTRYLEHLEVLSSFDMDLAGEFMVMAATLMFLKSQVLLPKEETPEDAEADPRMPLVQQLLEYERFKKAAEELDKIPWMFRDLYPRPLLAMDDFVPKYSPEEAPVEPIETYPLLIGLKTCLDRTHRKPVEIHSQSASLKESVSLMKDEFEKEGTDFIELTTLFPVQQGRYRLIISFLAMLELARMKFVEIIQTRTFGPIQVKAVKPLKDLDMGMLDQF